MDDKVDRSSGKNVDDNMDHCLDDSEDDLLDSQDLEEYAKDDEILTQEDNDKGKMVVEDHLRADSPRGGLENKSEITGIDTVEGTKRCNRMESADDMKIADKATTRAMSRDAFINKGTS